MHCAQHLNAIPHLFWADYAFPTTRYGHRTSNPVEQKNWVYKRARDKFVLDITTWEVHRRREDASKAHGLAFAAEQRFRAEANCGNTTYGGY